MHKRSTPIVLLIAALSLLVLLPLAAQDGISLPITADTSYTVQRGDALDTLGAFFDVSPTCLAETNDIEPTARLEIGQTLLVSVDCPVYGADPRDETVGLVRVQRDTVRFVDDCDGYRVQKADTLDEIGQELDVSVVALLEANALERGRDLTENTCLTIPAGAPPYGTVPASDMGIGGGAKVAGETYVVQRNDTLDVIGQEFDVSVVALQQANGIEDPRTLRPGMTLVVPAGAAAYGVFPPTDGSAVLADTAPSGFTLDVETGESLDDIAQQFDVSLRAIEIANGVNPGRNVMPGTAIFIPDNAPVYGVDDFDPATLGAGGGSAEPAVTVGPDTYIVQPRDTLETIAAATDKRTQCLVDANDLQRPALLQPGQTLFIDPACGPYEGVYRRPLQAADSDGSTGDAAADASGGVG